jgi:acylpyruvate hydrolase
MKLACFATAGSWRWGLVDGDSIRVAGDAATMLDAIADPGALRQLSERTLETLTRDEVELGAPVAHPPQFLGVGLNYHDHAAEVGATVPESPVIFGFHQTAIVGPGRPVELPAFTDRVDWEAELAVVIGSGGRDIPIGRALDCVAGYTIVNDVSARDIQKADGQWSRAKSFDTFKPMGPWIVTTDELGDASGLSISLTVNGEVKQSSNTDQLIFGVAHLVSFLSRNTTLLPGAVIATGTPGGVGFTREPPEYLRPGDSVEVTIEGIGTLAHRVVGDRDVTASKR